LEPVRRAGRYELVLHGHATRLDEIPQTEKIFFVVRDPVDRFVSAFNSRLRRGRPRYDFAWSESEREIFERFASADELARGLSSEDLARRRSAYTAMTSLPHVRDAYWRWFGNWTNLQRRERDLLLIQWFPDLTATFPRLCEMLELPGDLSLPTDDVKAHRSPPGSDRHLSENGRHNIAWWYASDAAFIELCAALDCFAGPSWTPV
jgi:hypothetical protein